MIGNSVSESQFGTAHLFTLVGREESTQLLWQAYDAGFTAFDTAPSYGFGESEVAVGKLVARLDPPPRVTTKVGLDAAVRPGATARLAKSAARRLPTAWQDRIRGESGLHSTGRFATDRVRTSIDESLRRLGRIDRLMLHEVQPDDITDELLDTLTFYVKSGDVTTVGGATANALAAQCLQRGHGVLTAAHVAVGPLATPASLPVTLIDRVGHGVFGPGGTDLAQLRAALTTDEAVNGEWVAATAGTVWDGPDGLANALVSRAAGLDLTTLIVATSRADRLAGLARLAAGQDPLLASVATALDGLIDRVHPDRALVAPGRPKGRL